MNTYELANLKWDSERSLAASRKRRAEKKAQRWEAETGMNAYRYDDQWLVHLLISFGIVAALSFNGIVV